MRAEWADDAQLRGMDFTQPIRHTAPDTVVDIYIVLCKQLFPAASIRIINQLCDSTFPGILRITGRLLTDKFVLGCLQIIGDKVGGPT